MDLRSATVADGDGIRRVARASLAASYTPALDDSVIDHAVENWYDEETLADVLADEERLLLVAVEDGEVAGFSQSTLAGKEDSVGAIQWLHVAPARRGHGVGAALLRETEAALLDRGATLLEGRVLVANEAGNEFYGRHGYERAGERELVIGEQTFTENTYARSPEGASPADMVEAWTTEDGLEVFVAFDERERGSLGSFYPVYRSPDRERRWGWLCANCESFDNAMDTMGRIECNQCGNRRRPERWDAAYL